MAVGNISKRSVEALRPGSAVAILWDDDVKGFGVKITPSGALTYLYQFRMGGREAKTQRYTIGTHGKLTPANARLEAKRLAVLVAQGINPADEDAKRRRDTVDLAFKAYSERFQKACEGEGWRKLVERSLRLHVWPVIAKKPLPAITRSDVVAVFDAMPAQQRAGRRNVFAILRRLFRWAISRGDIERSPMEGMETPPPVKARDRVLSDAELWRIWEAAPGCHRAFGSIVRLLMVTGQRREEVTGLNWAELNRDERAWKLPGERTKNGEPHFVPLNALAVAELDRVAKGEQWPKRGSVFITSSGGAFTAHSRGKAKLDKLVAAAGAPAAEWRLHDLRRSLATGMQRLGVRFEVTEAILNHLSGSRAGVAGVYQRHHWSDEKRLALDAWASHLSAVFAGTDETNVIPLAARRA
ncbi:integrase [Sphingomonas jinjuensis]|uniref:Integrase n=1 Tax=Sphingomonas jinjuensis TaxID=535907 RepID=A0A840FGY4_9SPHN|nr:site-specific integrase [Sphingomonas jinjuensis]MBB4153248.1 integrase [Sphingomonas jinjuensis]